MVQFNFERVYSLNISTPPREVGPPELLREFSTPIPFRDLDYRSEYDSITISELQIKCKVKINSDIKGANSNTTEIRIYNLSPQTRDKIAQENNFVNLKAGYVHQKDNLPLIFVGQITAYETRWEGPDEVTTLHCKDGHVASSSIRLNMKISSGARPPLLNPTYKDVFDKMISIWNSNGIASSDTSINYGGGTPPLLAIPADVYIQGSWIYSGYLKDAMDDLCESFSLIWYIHSNVLYIHEPNYKKANDLITIPSNSIKDIKKGGESIRSGSTGSSSRGVVLNTFLNGIIAPSKLVRVEDGNFKGDYTIKGVTHILDFRGSSWDTEVTCEVLND